MTRQCRIAHAMVESALLRLSASILKQPSMAHHHSVHSGLPPHTEPSGRRFDLDDEKSIAAQLVWLASAENDLKQVITGTIETQLSRRTPRPNGTPKRSRWDNTPDHPDNQSSSDSSSSYSSSEHGSGGRSRFEQLIDPRDSRSSLFRSCSHSRPSLWFGHDTPLPTRSLSESNQSRLWVCDHSSPDSSCSE